MAPPVRRVGNTFLIPYAEWRQRNIPDVGTRNDARVLVRRLDAQGNSLGPDILLASYDGIEESRDGYKAAPAVSPMANGGFLATWKEFSAAGSACYGRKFDANGQPQGTRITFSPMTSGGYGEGDDATVAALPNGNYVAAVVQPVPFEADSSY